jgi:myo-inositol-1(or 4)-monophosphatase
VDASRWLALCRSCAEDVARVLVERPARADREGVLGTGVGGDETTLVDDAAERAVVARLEALHAEGAQFTLVSEELGERRFGDGALRFVVDPIDGSVNAKRVLPFFSLSIAIADGARMEDVAFGYLRDFGSGQEWWAARGEGAWLDGTRLGDERPKAEIELLMLEGTFTHNVAELTPAFVGLAYRLRIMGSLALALCQLAAGRADAVCSLRPIRAVDIAAAQLLLRETGLAIDLPDARPFAASPLDTVARSRVVAGANEDVCTALAGALGAPAPA